LGTSQRPSGCNKPCGLLQSPWGVASLLVVTACVLLASAWVRAQSPVLVGRVTEVIDGDTIHVSLASGPIIVRLHSIDTPEHAQPWGRQAAAALERRLRKGTQVTLQPITQDNYDRLVAVVYLHDENVNAWMVRQGHAWPIANTWTMRSTAPGSSRRGHPAQGCGRCRRQSELRRGSTARLSASRRRSSWAPRSKQRAHAWPP
jgi:hypothetical protein